MRPALLLCAVLACASPSCALAQSPPAAEPDAPPERIESTEQPVSLEEIRRFVAVFRAVKQAYVDPIDDATLMRSAIRGLLIDLDPHSAYLDADQSRELNEATSGAYDGLGLEVIQQPDRSLLVIAPIDDTPAARAGIQPGDLIVEIDGKPIDASNVDAAVESMRGEPGSTIELTIVRETLREPLKLSLQRETIRVASVRVRRLEPTFGYLRISHFQADTARETRRKLEELQASGPALQGLVMDLRRNPGGLLNTAVEVADLFLESGVVVSTRGRLPFSVSEYRARGGDLLGGAAIVILTDSGTASAAEVLAAALRDSKRALLMGSPSFGKGSVQTVLPLDNGDSLKLTTARYYTPSGRSIQASGLVPDVELPEDAVLQVGETRPPTVREADLPRHLQSEPVAEPSAPLAAAEEADDFAVSQALALLKGLALFNGELPAAKPAQAAVEVGADAAADEVPADGAPADGAPADEAPADEVLPAEPIEREDAEPPAP